MRTARTPMCLLVALATAPFAAFGAQPAAPDLLPLCLAPPAEAEPNDTAATSTQLAWPCYSATGARSSSTDQDYFRVPLGHGTRLWALVDTGSPPAQAHSRDSVIEFLDVDGTTLLESDDDDGIGNGGDATQESSLSSAIAGRAAPADGIYYLRVSGFSSNIVDHYHLLTFSTFAGLEFVETEPNDTPATADRPSGPSDVYRGTLAAGDSDWYSFAAREGEEIFVIADCNPERDGSNTDVDLELVAPDGVTVLFTANSTLSSDGNGAEAFRFVLTTSGRHYLRAFGHDALVTGTYDLMVTGILEIFLDGFDAGNSSHWIIGP